MLVSLTGVTQMVYAIKTTVCCGVFSSGHLLSVDDTMDDIAVGFDKFGIATFFYM